MTMEARERTGGDLLSRPMVEIGAAVGLSPGLRKAITWAFTQAVESQTMNEWFLLVAKGFVNVMSGRKIFPLKHGPI